MSSRVATSRVVILVVTMFFASVWVGAQVRQPSSTDEATDAPRTGAISGRVVNESGQSIPNATVFVRAFGSAGQGRNTTTDREGNFQMRGLERLAYLVSASAPTYASAPRDPDSTQTAYYRVGDSITLVLIKGAVITGNVTTSAGEPVVAVRVRAYMLRDGNGKPLRYGGTFRERTTDDRGVYRIYGLPAGTYIVSAGGGGSFSGFEVNPYDTDMPTFSPASTRDTATEINVRPGEEAANVDIRYRGEPGHVVSGIATGPETAAGSSGFNIIMSSTSDRTSHWNNSSFQSPISKGFAFYGVSDGDYDLTAQSFFQGGDWMVSEPLRIKVRGMDITGIELATKPLSSIVGHVALVESKAPECKGKRRPLFAETLVSAWHNERNAGKDQPQFLWSLGAPTNPDKMGDFTLRNLVPGQYRIIARFVAKYWYLQSISLPSAHPATVRAASPTDVARNWLNLKTGDRVSGLNITLAEGAASLRGQITAPEGEKLPPKLFAYLIPAEREMAENVLRFFAVRMASDGTVAFNNLAPGRYWILMQPISDNESAIESKLRLPDENDNRAKLRRQAEAAKTEIEFQPCQNVTDYQFSLKPTPPVTSQRSASQ